jgi:hypothetical protein
VVIGALPQRKRLFSEGFGRRIAPTDPTVTGALERLNDRTPGWEGKRKRLGSRATHAGESAISYYIPVFFP